MKSSSKKYFLLFNDLTEAINSLLQEVKKHNLRNIATEKWTVKDVLSHITFWHNYYAQNYSSLAAGFKPNVFTSKDGSTRNQEGVNSLNHKSRKDLFNLLNKAQASLYKSIVIKEVPKMSYTDRRDYDTKEFLEMITSHIQRHTTQVKHSKIV